MGVDIHPGEIVIAIQTVQSLAALVLAALLLFFFRSFRHAFLQHWAFSTLALAVYLGFSAAALGLYRAGPAYDLIRFLCSAVSLGAAYPHVVWLMIGTWEAVRQKAVRRGLEVALVSAAALAGVVSAGVGAFDAQAGDLRTLLRVELRYALTGLAFLVAGVLLWRAQRPTGLVGARIGALGFCLFGLQMLHVFGINLAVQAGYPPPFYASYSGLIDFLFQSVIGLGIVVVSLGMNRYAMLNRAVGWQRTEQLIAEAAQRIHEAINQRCALGRVSDRDFVIARPTLDDADSIQSWVENLLASAIRPMISDGQEIFVTFCAGISIYPDDALEPEALLHHSQHALVQSTRIGRAVTLYQQIAQHDHGRVEAALQFESELRRGLSGERFELFYQPLVSVADRRVAGFEALLRGRHPERGVLRPAAFLDEAASIGVLDELESLALTSALVQLARWNRQGRTELTMAVNVSAQRFQRDDLVDRVVQACKRHCVSPDRLGLEVVAEGVESTAQFELLVEQGCDLAQGYLLQKPAAPRECAFGSIQLAD